MRFPAAELAFAATVFTAAACAQGPGEQPPAPVSLMEDTVEVPAAGWRTFDLEFRQRPAILDCRFSVHSEGAGVRVALVRRGDLDRLRDGRGHRILAATGFEREGRLRAALPPGDYSLLVDNRLEGRGPAEVWVKATVVFPPGAPEARVLSPERRAVVVATSLLLFLLVVLFAGRKLRRAMAHRPPPPQPPFYV
jgi:hypothetical protein